jgi:hypothetical protein
MSGGAGDKLLGVLYFEILSKALQRVVSGLQDLA